jgi:hypothetical protein
MEAGVILGDTLPRSSPSKRLPGQTLLLLIRTIIRTLLWGMMMAGQIKVRYRLILDRAIRGMAIRATPLIILVQ